MFLALILIPLIAMGFNIFLGMRLYDINRRDPRAYILGFGPIIACVWTFAGIGFVKTYAPGSLMYHNVVYILYTCVLSALLLTLHQAQLRGHVLWCLAFTIPSVIAPVLWGWDSSSFPR